MKQKFILVLSLFLFAVISVNAQVTSSKIKGIVTDVTGEPLFGASISVLHVPTGTLTGTTAQDNGRYTVLNLRVGGPYKITFSYLGFKTQEVNDVFLLLGKTTNIDGKLAEEGQSLDEIVISSSKNKTFNSDRTGAQTSVSAMQLKTLPTISRSTADFTRLEPSASGNSFGGRNDQFNNFSLDGAIFNNPFGLDAPTPGGQTGAQPISLDAIDQVSVSTAPYDVTLSGFTGASVNAVTKSGTNEFTGTVYGFYRNEDLTGSKVNGQDIFVPELTQNQYGVSIGGPIVKNKLFFFANFEKDERVDLGQNWLPNRGSGLINESRVLEQDLINVKNALAGIGYDTGSYEGFTHDTESTKGIFKLDWNVNENNRVAFIYNFLNASKDKPAHPTAINRRGPDFNTLQFQNSGYRINNKLNSFQFELNSNLTENTTNKLQLGYSHFEDSRDPFSAPAPVINIYKNGSPYIIAGHEPFSINNRLDQKVFQLTNNMNFFQGDHTYTVGFSFEKFMFKNSFNLKGYGFDVFGNVDINNFDANNYANALANAQTTFNTKNNLGEGVDGGWNLAEMNFGQLAFYVQDEWEVNNNFKLTYGIRFDKPLFFNTSELAQKFIDTENSEWFVPGIEYTDPETGNPYVFDSTEMPSNQWLISPRVGFNWDAKGDSSLQIRGGTGLFTGRLPFVWIGNQVSGSDVFFYQVVDPDFKFPQVWRTNIGIDKRLENGVVLTTDVSYTKDINGVHVQNWGLKTPSGTLSGVDNRPVYLAGDHATSFLGNANAYTLTNSNKGRIWNASFKAQKTFDNGLYTTIAYNYLNAKDVNSIEAEITGDAFAFNPALNNVNDEQLSYSKYGDTHRIVGVASKKWTYGNDKWSTTLSAFFEYAQGGRFNYTYGGDINGDGAAGNDLIYIPTTSEVTQMQFSGAGQATAFENYIQQDDYLNGRRGEYAERYGALAPWRGKWDIKLLQDLNINVGNGKTNTVQFSLDILNFGNLLNSKWGLIQQPNSVQPIGVSFDNAGDPVYTFDENQQTTFGYSSSLLSRWQAQIGLRYIF
ncbi:carboxypeptidase regulatory-like domain-containing protein [Polaribacter sp. KT 15]|uniref:TonB-dependent receptor n=1 Tax=Polaribacter sp. KT 15 TaxID=1896175 RepID=UPI00090A6C5A|nr:carboxypeptidase regulatory-like domain-containing protein [Polaribacter sp. KT 15]SHN09245.1 Outer membrane receptor proteins, mostly Fe transport [Polaribacter sp. KT 15]